MYQIAFEIFQKIALVIKMINRKSFQIIDMHKHEYIQKASYSNTNRIINLITKLTPAVQTQRQSSDNKISQASAMAVTQQKDLRDTIDYLPYSEEGTFGPSYAPSPYSIIQLFYHSIIGLSVSTTHIHDANYTHQKHGNMQTTNLHSIGIARKWLLTMLKSLSVKPKSALYCAF